MSADYYAALANSDDETRDRLRETRDRFLRYRNGCDSPACIAQAYEERRAEIHDIATGE